MKAHKIPFLSVLASLLIASMLVSGSVAVNIGEPFQIIQNSADDLQIARSERPNSLEYIPSKYSAVDAGNVTPVKDQGKNGTCWAFSAVSMAESSLIAGHKTVNGNVADLSVDLSEAQLVYFLFHPVADVLGNTSGDKMIYNSDTPWLQLGANQFAATFSLAGWHGLAYEGIIDYDDLHDESEYKTELDSVAAAHLQNAYFFPMTDTSRVKSMVMKYGSVLSMYYQDQSDENIFYNPDTYGYYSVGTNGYSSNHAICIVGWDDSYSADNFNDKPDGDGAWLIKNSWGSDWGDNGYFWISYYDAVLSVQDSYVYDFEDGDNYDNNYQYDSTGSITSIAIGTDSTWFSNVFTASAGGTEMLKAVSFATPSAGATYSVQIYLDVTGNPSSGTAVLDTPITGKCDTAGYYTVPLNQSIVLKEGQRYAVAVCLNKQGGAEIYTDSSTQSPEMSYINSVNPGESYAGAEMSPGRLSWLSLYDSQNTPRIKAFTDSTDTISADISGVVLDGDSWYRTDHDYYGTLIASGRSLPEALVITVDGVLTDDYSYDSTTGKIVIDASYGEILIKEDITVTCTHEWDDGTVTVMPTRDHDGEVLYTCKICGKTKIEPGKYILGDINTDFKINGQDANILTSYIIGLRSSINEEKADINNDGQINGRDSNIMKQIINGMYE